MLNMAFDSPFLYLLLVILLLLQLQQTLGSGRLYVGFTQYNNNDNRRGDGECCDGGEDQFGRCSLSCDLIFDLSISQLDGPNTMHRRPSDTPFSSSGQSRLPFQSLDQDIMNPLTFTFNKWPICLDVVVEIYDVDLPTSGNNNNNTGSQVLQLVDTMTLQIALARPSSFFNQRRLLGQREIKPSSLTVVIRYDCDKTGSTDDPCPPDSIRNITSLPDNIMECPTSPPTQPSSTTTSTTTTPTTTPTAPTQPSSTAPTTTSEPATTEKTAATTKKTTTPSTTPRTTTTKKPTSVTGMTTSGSSATAGLITPKTTKEENNGPMEYWAIILGAVLGTLVVIGVIGFVLYTRRRKSMYKRQEIYTVTPRLVSEVEENGTAGRSDIPVETTQY